MFGKVLVAILVLAALVAPASAFFISDNAIAIDGDSLRIGDITVRLFGIDAPEGRQTCKSAKGGDWPCGRLAAERLAELLRLGPIACHGDEFDDFDRLVAVCDDYAGNTINATLVSEGLAWAFVRYSRDYVAEEAFAREAGLGIWQAQTTAPWDYRVAGEAAPIGCLIKGNVSRRGNRIYHLPGSPDYDAVNIRTQDGERWFCSEEEAVAAGWRTP